MKSKWLIIGLVATVIIGAVYFITREDIHRGLTFPGIVGTAADQYFFNGEQLDPRFQYATTTLGDGSVWKIVEADTANIASKPSWLIIMVQGPNRETLVLQERFDEQKKAELVWMMTDEVKLDASEFTEQLKAAGFGATQFK